MEIYLTNKCEWRQRKPLKSITCVIEFQSDKLNESLQQQTEEVKKAGDEKRWKIWTEIKPLNLIFVIEIGESFRFMT